MTSNIAITKFIKQHCIWQ